MEKWQLVNFENGKFLGLYHVYVPGPDCYTVGQYSVQSCQQILSHLSVSEFHAGFIVSGGGLRHIGGCGSVCVSKKKKKSIACDITTKKGM